MSENMQRDAAKDDGPGRQDGKRRTRGWIMGLALLGLGATGGTLATIAVDASAHGGWGHGFGHHWRGHAADATHVTERLQHASEWVLGKVDATEEQQERIDAILAGAVDDIFPLRAEHDAHRRDLMAELARPQIDRAALERVRTAELALAEQATARLLDATVAIAEVLDTEQRQQLVERFAERRRH